MIVTISVHRRSRCLYGADEPTGSPDSYATTEIMDLICELNHEGRTVVLITHERSVAALARRAVVLEDGRIVSDKPASGALVF